MTIEVLTAGEFEGQRVDEAVLTGEDGAKVHLLNWGVVVRDWQVPVEGGLRSVVLGFEDFAPYPEHSPHFGAIAGRVANRIRNAEFILDGTTYKLPANENGHTLHGGPEGIGRQVWAMEPDSESNSVRFAYRSPDGEMGFPGTVDFIATYTLTGRTLRLDLEGYPSRPTPISLVQHQYFNLGTSETVLDHNVHMPSAVARTESDPDLVPTGAILPVRGTEYDFLMPRSVRLPDGSAFDYDLNLVLATGRNKAEPIVICTGEDERLTLKLWSDRPGVQFYNGVWTDCPVPGLGGRRYGKHSGLCFEDQMFPDALEHRHFPDIICTPDRPYRHWCEIEIG